MKNFTLLLCILISLFSSAQEVKWGADYDSKLSKEKLVFIGETETSFYLLRHTSFALYTPITNIYIEKYSKTSQKLEAYTSLDMPEADGAKTYYHDLKVVNNQIILFIAKKKDNTYKIYGQKVDAELKYNGAPMEVGSIDVPPTKLNFSTNDNPLQDMPSKIYVSKSGITFFVVQAGYKKGDPVYNVEEFDHKINTVRKFSLPISKDQTGVEIREFEGISKGNFFILSASKNPLQDPPYGTSLLYNLISHNAQSQKTEVYPVLHNQSFKGIGVCYDNNSNIILAALQMKKGEKYYRYSTCFGMRISNTPNTPVVSKVTALPEKFIKDVNASHTFRSIIPEASGGFYMVFENITGSLNALIWGNINIVKVNNEMEFQWFDIIGKQQTPKYGYVWEQVSYNLFVHNNQLYFLFNDHPDNKEINADNRKKCDLKSTATFMVQFTPDQVKLKTLVRNYDGKKDIVMFGGTGIEYGNKGKPFIYSGNKEKFRIGELVWTK